MLLYFLVKIDDDSFPMQALVKSLDFIIDTASGDHPFDPYLSLLKPSGVLVVVAAPSEVKFSPGSIIGGMLLLSYRKVVVMDSFRSFNSSF